MKTTIKMLTLGLITLLLNILYTQTSKAQCHIDDWTALKALYESTNGDFWTNRTGWGTVLGDNPPANCNLGSLYGISLDDQGRVYRLDLINNELSGNIPIELGILRYLQNLNLGNNELSGSIPTELNNLSSLVDLRLSLNDLSGSIPAELDNLNNLTHLNLHQNLLSGSIPAELGNLSNLTFLDLGGNQLSGSIPIELSNLSNLTDFRLYFNELSGSIPSEFGNLSELTLLWLDYNQLVGSIPPELGNLSNLQDLRLSANQLSGSIPSELGNLSNLQDLRLSSNQLSGSIPSELGNLSNLDMLSINNNNLSDCFDNNLIILCEQLTSPFFDGNPDISDDNNFDVTWDDFCTTSVGACEPCGCTDPNACNYNPNASCDDGNCEDDCETSVYPGDLNHDGIVNNQDVSLSGLFQYQSGISRTPVHQNTNWYAHPSQNWNIVNNQNIDIKHHDCNGDGTIDEADQQTVDDNMGLMWETPDTIDPPDESDYQVMLHPIDEIYDGYLVMNVALERREGGNLTLQGGHFTVDYSDVVGDFRFVNLGLSLISWLGVPENNLWFESTHFPSDKKIEVGFTKTNNTNSTGSGVIGQLILEYDNSSVLLSSGTLADNYQFQVNTIGVHQSDNTYILIEDQQLQVNLTSNCEPNWNINEDSPFQNLYQSSNNLTTSGFVIIGEDQEVEYKANRIRINSGFSAKAGAKFKVQTGGCN